MTTALLVFAAYLVGTFPSAVLVARSRGVDITSTGSGNPGASNVTRTLGWQRGALVLFLDALKGALPVAVALIVADRPAAYAGGIAAVLGHMYPVTRPPASRWRGGKGVATVAGVMVVLHPVLVALMTLVWFAVSRITRTASLGSIAIVVLMPVAMALTGTPGWEIVAVIGLGALILMRHWSNIARLIRREEHRLGKNR